MSNISCRSVGKTYGSVEVIKGFDLDVQENEFVVFLGPSGCGKSTILRMISGLEAITEGEVFIDGRLVNDLLPRDRNVAMVFQNYALYPHMSVYGNIAFGLRRMKVEPAALDSRVREVAEMLGLREMLDRMPASLSGGQQQRVAIARAMSKTPGVFLFDEPLSNLDAQLRRYMRIEIARLHQRLRTTSIFVTHDQHEAMTLADRIVLLRDGKIEQIGTPREIFEKPRTRFVAEFIGSPPMNLFEIDLAENAGINGFSVPPAITRLAGESSVIAGVRPSDLHPAPAHVNENVIEGTVDLVEFLGSEALVNFRRDETEMAAIFPGSYSPAMGSPIRLAFAPDCLHFFDKRTGLAMSPVG
ncbi:MAG TPA: sn-glycerol-3-phosphate ABC transporter ATP-binding protein UgpC [Bradyrhizobium sp.]